MDEKEFGPVGAERLEQFLALLQKYKSGKAATERRIISSENWWKLRNCAEERAVSGVMAGDGFKSSSGWLHNVIASKHADAMEAFPQPVVLPREPGDREEAGRLSAILPCIYEQNHFEQVYSDVAWQKLKTGTGVYKIIWDKDKLGGLGDIAIERVNLLNLYWEPGVTDIQKSRAVFQTELWDKEALKARYPQLRGKLKGQSFVSTKFLYDDTVDTSDKATVIDIYYRREQNGRSTLQYAKFVDSEVLYATENDPELLEKGLYDHGSYPFVFDTLFPIEGSPCGYGFVDLCRNPQTAIDLLNTAFVRNAMVGATPRFFQRQDGSVNEGELLNLASPLVHVDGNLGEDSLRQIRFAPLDGIYVSMLDRTIQELRETSGNTETSTGNIASGVTAASAIAALQEASGKGTRDSNRGAYRAFAATVEMSIELIRQFYALPRQFRITGELGRAEYVSYTNSALLPQHQGNSFGMDMGYRLPVFDIRVCAQRQNAYTRMSQNELALQLYSLGFFDPARAGQAARCLALMDFEGRDELLQQLSAAAAPAPLPAASAGLTMPEGGRVQRARAAALSAPEGTV